MIDLTKLASNLVQRDDGVWVARVQNAVSYPDDGNEACFAVEDDSFWFRHRNSVITELVKRFSPTATFFDIGGGNGCVSIALQSAGIDTVLLEPGPTGVRNARERGLCTVIQSTLGDAGFARQSIQAAGIFDVVEHIEDDTGFISLLGDYLQPNGLLYVTVPAFQFLWSNDDVHAGHFRRYSVRSLSGILTRSGFDVAYCGYLFSFLVPPILLLRSIPSLLGLRKSVSRAVTEREHSSGSGLAHRIVNALLRSELERVKRAKPVRFGSSCIAVARRKA